MKSLTLKKGISMNSVIDKELISHLLKLEESQQDKVLAYIKSLLVTDEMNNRAAQSEKDIAEGNTINASQFNQEFEQWKVQKRASIK
jgi:hypothetical protein